MPNPLGSLVDVVLELVAELERSDLPYALGGAIAYGAWGEPRATRDVDLNLWVDRERLEHAFEVLASAGVRLDRARAAEEAEVRGMFVGHHGEYRVDVFVPSVPFYQEALHRRVRVPFADRDVWVLSPESLAVFKLLFFRPKDLVDLRRLLQIQGARFDSAFVRRSVVEMLGEGDERVREWDRLVAETS